MTIFRMWQTEFGGCQNASSTNILKPTRRAQSNGRNLRVFVLKLNAFSEFIVAFEMYENFWIWT